jgi:nucleobase:cation symporter-1, NCS1 family
MISRVLGNDQQPNQTPAATTTATATATVAASTRWEKIPMTSFDEHIITTDIKYTDSPLYNVDLAPTSIEQRTWDTYHIASLWISMAVVITTYTLGGSFVAQGMTWWQALATILTGNGIVLVPLVLNAHAGTRYGVSFPVLCRSSFGIRGAHVPAVMRAIVLCGWFGIQTWIGGEALDVLLTAVWPYWVSVPAHAFIMFGIFWCLQLLLIIRGVESIRVLESVAAPLLLLASAVLLGWAIHQGGGLATVLSSVDALREQHTELPSFWSLFPAALAASCSYWATLALGISDFTRYASSQRAQMLGQAIGLPLTMASFSFIGVVTTAATIVCVSD